jgi:hypothetical protein
MESLDIVSLDSGGSGYHCELFSTYVALYISDPLHRASFPFYSHARQCDHVLDREYFHFSGQILEDNHLFSFLVRFPTRLELRSEGGWLRRTNSFLLWS